MTEPKRGTIRFEDLGAPIQRLFKSMAGKISEDDMALVQEYVSVKDMAKIFQELGSDRGAEAIWAELREALLARKRKQLEKQAEYDDRAKALLAEQVAEEEAEAEEERLRQEAAEKAKRKAEKRKAKAEAAASAAAEEEERLRLEAEQAEAERLEAERAEEEARAEEERRHKKDEKKRKRKEEEERLLKERDDAEKKKSSKRDHKKDWEDFVASHPLEYSESAIQEIQQKPKQENQDGLAPRATLAASTELLSRTFTPYCPVCHAKYSKPPPEWDCSMCLRKFRQHVKCWQPDDKTPNCMVCKKSVGRFTRHHCRNCGRVCCSTCTDFQAKITSIGYNSPVRVCRQCVDELGTVRPAN